MDIYDHQVGRGVGGRMADVLKKIGFSPNTLSMNGVADALVGLLTKTFTLDPFEGVTNLNPRSSAEPIWERVKKLNAE
jgi:hypothetical protein